MTKWWKTIAVICGVCVGAAASAAYPDRPIRIVVPFAAGSAPDILARLLAEQLGQQMRAQVVVQNSPGAGGNIAVGQVAAAAPDGYTLVLAGDAAIVVNPSIYERLPFHSQRDLAPISQVALTPNVLLVSNDLQVKDVAQLVDAARAKPGQLSYASVGAGTSSHRAGELFKRAAGIDLVHVPYKNSPLPDVVAGRVGLFFANAATGLPLAREGKVRALAVSSLQRLTVAPELPTMDESGFPGFEAVAWFGLLSPAATPPEIVHRLQAETSSALRQPSVRDRLAAMGAQPVGSTPEAFKALIASELPRWSRLMREAGIKAD